jgi:tetratricopeptide (TPR) repeat protein
MNRPIAVLVVSLGIAAAEPLSCLALAQGPATGNVNAAINEARRDAEGGQLDAAIANYQRALTLITDATRAYDPVIRFNLATLHAAKGIDAFQADNLDQAIASFRSSLEWNAYSRDIRYNLCQAMYIQGTRMKEEGAPAADLVRLYGEILTEAAKVREADPANPNLLLLMAYTHRNLGDEDAAARAFADQTAMAFEVTNVRMDVQASETRLSGIVRNRQQKEGDRIRLRFTMLALNGTPMAAADVEVNAPAVDGNVPFDTRIRTTQDVAGWRYEVQ